MRQLGDLLYKGWFKEDRTGSIEHDYTIEPVVYVLFETSTVYAWSVSV